MVHDNCHHADLKFLFEASGLFSELRMNRELKIKSRGQISTINSVQNAFIKTLASKDNIEKDVIITGPVSSGKFCLGMEAINIKMSHYTRKYGLSKKTELDKHDIKNRLRVIIVVGSPTKAEQIEYLQNYWSLEVHASMEPNPESLKVIFQGNENYRSYNHTLIMLDGTGTWR